MNLFTKKQKLEALNKAVTFVLRRGDTISGGVCVGLCQAEDDEIWCYLDNQFNELFTPDNVYGGFFFAYEEGSPRHFVGGGLLPAEEMKSRRLLALAFLIAMVEAGDL